MVEFIKKTGKKRAGLFCRFFLYYFFLMEAQVHLVVYPGFQHIGTLDGPRIKGDAGRWVCDQR